MVKGKFGLALTAIAVIAFSFVILGQPILVLLICGFALLAEKDEWLNRQVVQALMLAVIYYLIDLLMSMIFGGLAQFFGWVKLYSAASAMGTTGSIVSDVLYLALIVFCIIAIVRVLGGKDAALPLISKMAGGDFTATCKPKTQATAAPAQPAQPVQAVPYGTPYAEPSSQAAAPIPPQAASGSAPMPPATAQVVSASAPVQPAATQAAPVPSVRLCPACSAPLYENSEFCTTCGTKIQR